MKAAAPELAVRTIAYTKYRNDAQKLHLSGTGANVADVTVKLDTLPVPVADVIRNGTYWLCVFHKYDGSTKRSITISNGDKILTVGHRLKIGSPVQGGFTVDEFTYDPDTGMAYASGIGVSGVEITVHVQGDPNPYPAPTISDGSWSRAFPLTEGAHHIIIESRSGYRIEIDEDFDQVVTFGRPTS